MFVFKLSKRQKSLVKKNSVGVVTNSENCPVFGK